jgi:peptide-methionine (S)-S-oxide reductase
MQEYVRRLAMTKKVETATLAGGCFWCLEAVYEMLRGVQKITSGYAGGHVANPDYYHVCTGTTGHAEVVQIEFDPDEITYQDILDIFFTIHDPTTLNRQGPDSGTQYRSAIFYHSPEQKEIAESTLREVDAEGAWEDPLVTEVVPLEQFYPAEEYHQQYFQRNPNQGYCQVIIAPKVTKARKLFLDRLKREVPTT